MSNTEDRPPASRKFVSFLLTLIAVPILFVATCAPAGFVGLIVLNSAKYFIGRAYAVYGAYAFIGFLILFGIGFIGVQLRRANQESDPGVRWGIVVAVTGLAGLAAALLVLGWDFIIKLH